jgi:ATP-dependent RNA helicase RhlE
LEEGIGADAIHGNKSQGQRQKALDTFRKGDKPVLIATDIAARGIDIRDVELVVNYDLPNVPESYVHRIGRTARAGASGFAVTFCAPDEIKLLLAIEKVIKQQIPAMNADGSKMTTQPPRPTKPAKQSPRGRGAATAGQPDVDPNKRPWHKRRTTNAVSAVGPKSSGKPHRGNRKPSNAKAMAS